MAEISRKKDQITCSDDSCSVVTPLFRCLSSITITVVFLLLLIQILIIIISYIYNYYIIYYCLVLLIHC